MVTGAHCLIQEVKLGAGGQEEESHWGLADSSPFSPTLEADLDQTTQMVLEGEKTWSVSFSLIPIDLCKS